MLYLSINIFSNILADKLIPLPSIDVQPTFIVPHEILDVKHDMNWCWYADRFYSLYFSINYHFDDSTNTLEMIRKNFDLSEDPKIVLKRYVAKSAAGDLLKSQIVPREILLPTCTIRKGLYRMFIASGPHDGQSKHVNLNVGCRLILLYMDHTDIEEILKDPTTPSKEIPNLFKIHEESDYINHSFQFFVTIKKSSCDKDEDPYVTISTDVFRIDFSGDFTKIKCLKVNKEDYLTEEDLPDLEGVEIKDSSEEVEKNLGMELSPGDQKNEEQVSHGSLSKVDDSTAAENTNPQTDFISC